MPFEHITSEEWAYFAGVIDSEGCINIYGQKSRNSAFQFRDSYKGLKPCARRPLPVEITKFRAKCMVEFSRIKNKDIPREAV